MDRQHKMSEPNTGMPGLCSILQDMYSSLATLNSVQPKAAVESNRQQVAPDLQARQSVLLPDWTQSPPETA